MSRRRKIRRTPGDILAIPLGSDGRVAFGLVLEEPLVAFYNLEGRQGTFPALIDIVSSRVAFRIWVMNQPIINGDWPIIGHAPIPAELREDPWFFKQDPVSGKVTITRTGAEELTPAQGQADTLERAAVWSAEHVVDRLRDHFDGRANRWVDSMRLR